MPDSFEMLRGYWWVFLITVPLVAGLLQAMIKRAAPQADASPASLALPCSLQLRGARQMRPFLRLTLAALLVYGGGLLLGFWEARESASFGAAGTLVVILGVLLALLTIDLALSSELHLSADRIEMRSGLPAWLSWIYPSWSFDLGRLQTLGFEAWSLGAATDLPHLLTLEGAGLIRKLVILEWIEPGASALLWQTRENLTRQIDRAPLVRFFRERGHALSLDQVAVANHPDLLRSTRARGALYAMAALLGYAAVEGVGGGETYATRASELLGITSIALIGTSAAVWLQRGGRLEWFESTALGVVLGVAATLALYPGALRLNQLSDREGLRVVRYEQGAGHRLEALDPGAPELRFWFQSEYLGAFPPGTVHEVELRRGGLGFYQLRKAPLLRRLRATRAPGGTEPEPAPPQREAKDRN